MMLLFPIMLNSIASSTHGDKVKISNPLLKKEVYAEECNPVFVDPNGDRLRE